jgi:Raf kinase inhibitor-like YbhB/YbcL family protein
MNSTRILLLLLMMMGMLVAGCGAGQPQPAQPAPATPPPTEPHTAEPAQAPTATLTLRSPAFGEGTQIPVPYTCDGENRSPALTWDGAPEGTQSFALIMDDPDAPGQTFTHWLLFDLPADTHSLAEGASGDGIAGQNSFGDAAYGGPCPPPGDGAHRYFFTLAALDTPTLNLTEGASREEIEAAIEGHILASGQWMGRYER